MKLEKPLSPTLSPSEGERATFRSRRKESLTGERAWARAVFSLSPSEGERAGERGPFNCIVTAKGGTPNGSLPLATGGGLKNCPAGLFCFGGETLGGEYHGRFCKATELLQLRLGFGSCLVVALAGFRE